MAGYVRQSNSSIQPGEIVKSGPVNNEFNAIRDAFSKTSGHKHDGSTAEGAFIPEISDTDNYNKVVIDTSNNRIGFFSEVSSAAVEQVRIQDGAIVPVTDNDIDFGTSSLEFKDLFIDGTATIDTLTVDESATITANLTVNGNTTLGNAASDTVTLTADVASAITPSADDTHDLGAVGSEWRNLYVDGQALVDDLVADTADINGGTIDDTVIGGNSAAAGTFTDLTSTGTMTIATVDINGGAIDGVTIGGSSAGAGTFTTVTASGAVVINGGLTMDTDKFTVADTSGNTSIGGTLTVSGATTLAATSFGDADITNVGNIALDSISADGSTITITGNTTFADGSFDFNIASHDGTNGLALGGTVVTASAAELNIMDGVTATTAELNIMDGVTSTAAELNILDGVTSTAAELNILDGVTATATEINILDGDTSATSTTVADADRVVLNDNGTMVQVAVTDLAAYFDDEITAMPNLVTTAATTVGALDSGSITSGFGTIDTGSSTITTTGNITGGNLIISDGGNIGSSSDTDAISIASGGNVTMTQDLTVTGNLTVNGSTSTISSTNTTIEDALIELGTGTSGTPSNDAGIVIERGSADNAFIGYDESADKFIVGTGSFTGASTGNLTITTGTLVANVEGNVTGNVSGSSGSTTGNAATATALETARTIGGVSFDGTANINLPGVNASGTQDTSGNAATATALETARTIAGQSFDGTGNITIAPTDLTGVTSTATELNVMDGDTSATSTTLADADRVVVNDAGTMKQVALTDFETYMETSLDTLSNVTTVGALDSGSITSGFGAIDNGSSNITTSGIVQFGSLSDGTVTVTDIADEDDFSSNSATKLATQQSIKAYVDSTAGQANNVTNLTATGVELNTVADASGVSINTSTAVAANDALLLYDNSGASIGYFDVDLLDTYFSATTKTLTNKTLTSPTVSGLYLSDAGLTIEGSSANDHETVLNVTDPTADRTITFPDATGTVVTTGNLSAITSTGTLSSATISGDLTVDTSTLKVDSSNNRVGIGTSSPSSHLHVKSTSDNIVATRVSTNSVDALFQSIESAALAQVGTTGAHAFTLFTSNQERMRITSDGSVGIGTSAVTPYQAGNTTLEIDGGANKSELRLTNDTTGASANNANGAMFHQSGNATYLWNLESDILSFGTSNSEAMRITSDGSVGIGTSSPDTALNVVSSSTQAKFEGSVQGNIIIEKSGTDGMGLYSNAAGTLAFYDNNSGTERMRINSNGDVGIGTAAPTSYSTYRYLDIVGGATNTGGVLQLKTSDGSINLNMYSYWAGGIFGTTTNHNLSFITNNSTRVVIDSSGNVGIGTSSPISPLHINVGTNQNLRVFTANSAPTIASLNDANSAYAALGYTGSQHEFRIGTSETMRIDSSGNLLVGKTSANATDAGIVLNSTGRLWATASGDDHIFNRTSSDGSVVSIRQDGIEIGSLQTSGNDFKVAGTVSNIGGIQFGNSKMMPVKSNSLANDAVDLGSSSYKWKDAYVSRNIYLGSNIYHDGDTDTYIGFATNQINLYCNGSQAAFLNDSGIFIGDGSLSEDYDALSGTTPTCDVNNGGMFSLTMSGNTTFTFSSGSSGYSQGFILQLTGNGGTVTYPNSVDWAGGTAPDAPANGETDILVFITRDGGTTWYGALSIDAAG